MIKIIAALLLSWYATAHAQRANFGFFRPPLLPDMTSTFTGSAYSISDLTSYTFAGINFGTASADRYLVVGFAGRSGFTYTVTSVTVDGRSATILSQYISGGSMAGFALVHVPTGTSGPVVITFEGQMVTAAVGVWAVTNLTTNAATGNTFWTTASTGTVAAQAGGYVYGMGYNNNSHRPWNTGITSDFVVNDTLDNIQRKYTGGSVAIAATGNKTVTNTGTSSSGITVLMSLR